MKSSIWRPCAVRDVVAVIPTVEPSPGTPVESSHNHALGFRIPVALMSPVLALALSAVPVLAIAQSEVHVYDEYNKLIQQRSNIDAFGPGGFGERINLNDGSLDIVQTDVDIPGNNAIPVTVSRRFTPADIYNVGHFGFWNLEIPNIHGTFSAPAGWKSGSTYNRCSSFGEPPMVTVMGGYFSAKEYWHGTFLYLPGTGDQEMLRAGTSAHVPTDGSIYPIVTKSGAAARCVPLASSSESGSQGEGFEVRTPDGLTYRLDHMVSRITSTLKKEEAAPEFFAASTEQPDASEQDSNAPTTQLVPDGYVLGRKEIRLYPTKVTDRFGNFVTYTWNPDNPWQLQDITASDGRHIHFTYVDATSWRVATVSDGTRTWTYGYGTLNDLTSVTRPDGSTWTFAMSDIGRAVVRPTSVTCDIINATTGTYTGSITSPSNAKLDFTLSKKVMGRSWVYRECIVTSGGMAEHVAEPYLFLNLAVASKKIIGPGLPTAGLSWTYAYGPANNCWNPAGVYNPTPATVVCNASSPTTRQVSVTDPDGSTTRYTYGNRYQSDEGLLLKTDYGWNGTSALRTVAVTYADWNAAPYAAFNGNSIRQNGDYYITGKTRPQRQVTTTQQGRTFTWQVATGCAEGPYCFDAFARPTKVTKSSAPAP